jgi:dipeptidyl aminopeptidase/acylaminoacyl peptidase
MSSPHLASLSINPVVILFGLIAFIALAPSTATAVEKQPFEIDDYFKIKRVIELSLSSDGEMVAYTFMSQDLEQNKSVRAVYISATDPRVEPILIDSIQNARSLAWIPGTHELAFLLSDGVNAQVHSINTEDNKIRQHTSGDDTVVKFRFAPDGGSLAWLTQTDLNNKPSPLYERLFNGNEGVVIDSENTAIYHFVNPERPDFAARSHNLLWLKRAGEEAFRTDALGHVKSFYWSTDASKLSITFVAHEVPKEAFFDKYTSLGVFDVATKAFRVVAHARPPSEMKKAQYYTGGEWVPREDKLFIRRTTERDRWMSNTEWTSFDFATGEALESGNHNWKEIDIYGLDSEPAFVPVNANTVFSNRTVQARQFLYQVTPSGVERADILQDVGGSVSFVRFSAAFETATFVNESLTHPPEIYVWQKGYGSQKLTRLNQEIAEKQLPSAREVTWKSEDGVTVQGWLLEPVGEKSEDNKPRPLITFVHGGPGLAMPDKFGFYFKALGGLWPYPFEAYAVNNIAVFIPNYRGTKSFGDKFADPTSIDGEPVDDIVSGIEYLIGERIADPERLAISGHSHGGWLAPFVMTRAKIFRAASIAEGTQNKIVNYSLMPGNLNRVTHDTIQGASLYDDPQRYVDLSPDLHFAGLDTAVLFEAGAKSLAINMMGSPKAAQRAGMPAEFIVYPRTGHNIRLPRLQKESAERNLDWFRFWLLGEEDSDPVKAQQYERWRKLRPASEMNN